MPGSGPFNKVEFGGTTLIDLTSDTVDANHLATGYTAHDKTGNIVTGIMNGLPNGISKASYGSYSLASASNKTSTIFSVDHNLGAVPDLFILYAVNNPAASYSYVWVAKLPTGYRSSDYVNYAAYHPNNSTTNVTISNYGSTSVLTLSTTTASVKSASSTYYWRAATYRWIALKLG